MANLRLMSSRKVTYGLNSNKGAKSGTHFELNSNGTAKIFHSFRQRLHTSTKEVVGIRVLLTRSLFGDGIPRRLLLGLSLTEIDFCSFAILMGRLAVRELIAIPLLRLHNRESKRWNKDGSPLDFPLL
jgi:hypothetical protein